jgi:hypothetical protein
MKKIIIVLTVGIILLSLNACTDTDEDMGDDDWFDIDDTLRISAFLFDEEAGENYFILSEQGVYFFSINENVYGEKDGLFYVPERLSLNEVRLMYPMAPWGTAGDMINLNILFEGNGEIEVISENQDVQLSVDFGNPSLPFMSGIGGTRQRGFELKVPSHPSGVFIAAAPLGSNRGDIRMEGAAGNPSISEHYIGREYYLTVNRYSSATTGMPVATARLKLVQLEDKTSAPDFTSSGVFSIELISYEARYKD